MKCKVIQNTEKLKEKAGIKYEVKNNNWGKNITPSIPKIILSYK